MHGIAETHVLHHVSNKISLYNAWEASEAFQPWLKREEVRLEGEHVGWRDGYGVYRECKIS